MSLQVWLPLNGSLENKGLEQNYKIEKAISGYADHTTLISNTINGKVTPTSYKWELNGQAISINKYMNQLKKYSTYSISCWLYYTDKASHEAMAICSSGDWNVVSGKFNFALWGHNGTGYTKILVPSTVAAWNGAVITLNNPSTIQPNKWYHLCLTCDSKMFKLYVNGILQENQYDCSQNSTIPSSPSDENLFIGCATYYNGMTIKGSINDFRIYDHCLSPREVKLLAQGLVAHYKLDDPNIEPTTNILNGVWQHTNFSQTSLGTYSLFSNQLGSGSLIEVRQFNNHQCLYIKGGSGSRDRCYRSIAVSGDKSYTFSLDLYSASTTNVYIKCEASGGDYGTSQPTLGSAYYTTPNQWQRLSFTIKPDTNPTLYFFIQTPNNNVIYINNIQLEEKDHPTPYTSSSRLGEITYDCSGYGNHGTAPAALEMSTDSPRYSYAALFKDNKYIQTTRSNYEGMKNTYSFVYWAKHPASSMNGKMVWGFYDGPNAKYLDLFPSGGKFTLNNGGISDNLPFNVDCPTDGLWHHYAVIGDINKAYLYIDGQYKGETSGLYEIPNAPLVLSGWNTWETDSFGWNNGHISDFRLYATALSAAAVKELYQSSISFLDNGTLQCSEIVENSTNLKYNKNGIVQAAKIEEANTNLKLYNDKIQTFQIYEL